MATNEEIFCFDPSEEEPKRPLPRSIDAEAFFRERKEACDKLRTQGLLHTRSPRPATMLMPVYNMRRDTAQVYLRPRWREGERADMLFFAILEPMDSEGHSAIFNRLDHDRVRREERTPKDAFRWQPYQVRSLKAHEQRSPALYRTSWDFTDPMKSLERLFRQRENSADLERKLKQLESGVYVHVPTTAAPRRAPRNP